MWLTMRPRNYTLPPDWTNQPSRYRDFLLLGEQFDGQVRESPAIIHRRESRHGRHRHSSGPVHHRPHARQPPDVRRSRGDERLCEGVEGSRRSPLGGAHRASCRVPGAHRFGPAPLAHESGGPAAVLRRLRIDDGHLCGPLHRADGPPGAGFRRLPPASFHAVRHEPRIRPSCTTRRAATTSTGWWFWDSGTRRYRAYIWFR